MAKFNLQSAISKNVKTTLSNTYSSVENIKQQIIVLEELRSWIPAPAPEELKQLELNIVANGCRDALILWETVQKQIDPDSDRPTDPVYVLVDGHNRYQICKSRNISFNIQLMDFADLKSVKDFMIDLQLGRRNLTPQQITYFRGLRYLNEKNDKGKYSRTAGNDAPASVSDEVDNGQPPSGKAESTAEKLAREYKVGRNTILRDADYAAGLEQLTPELKKSILTGLVKVDKVLVQKLGKTPVDSPVETLDTLRELVAEDTAAPSVKDSKKALRQRAEEDLMLHMQELITSKSYTRKQIDQLIEKAAALKSHIK